MGCGGEPRRFHGFCVRELQERGRKRGRGREARFVHNFRCDAALRHWRTCRGMVRAGVRILGTEPARPVSTVVYRRGQRSDEHTSELQSLMRPPYAVFGLKKKKE